ncbi:hypothetical protein FOFC_01622 [Fusarium oxysporum]|nr:hypothetical protein FOFC_01622 [Fusarium oxysporum]
MTFVSLYYSSLFPYRLRTCTGIHYLGYLARLGGLSSWTFEGIYAASQHHPLVNVNVHYHPRLHFSPFEAHQLLCYSFWMS